MRPIDPLGPDQTDLRLRRPYYVLPIKPESWDSEPGPTQPDQDSAAARIKDGIANAPADFTDIYIVSHGWHRNFYGAISTYDRVLSRMTRLLFRGRITPPANYNPLFICLHWKSEVGEDTWVDFAGRRHRDDYKELALERFAASGAAFENFLDAAFVLFSEYSAPDGGDPNVHSVKAHDMMQVLVPSQDPLRPDFPLKNEPAGLPPGAAESQRAQALWSCYHEALAKGVRGNQPVQPSAFAPGRLRFEILAKFIFAVIPLLTLIGFILGEAPEHWWEAIKTSVNGWPPASPLFALPASFPDWLEVPINWIGANISMPIRWLLAWTIVFAVCGIVFSISCAWSQAKKKAGEPGGVGWITLIAYLPVQLTFAAPVLLALLIQYLAFFIPWFRRFQFSERNRKAPGRQPSISGPLANLARVPSLFLMKSLSPASSLVRTVATGADSQLAFFAMQRRGAETGQTVAKILLDLWNDPITGPKLAKTRLYMAGHSFGGLVVANAARSFVRLQKGTSHRIESVAFIEAAMASGWFNIEHRVLKSINNRLSSIYSVADSATGFYYPVANGGRLALGSVGFCDIPDVLKPKDSKDRLDVESKPCPPGCTKHHVHKAPAFAVLDGSPPLPISETGPTVTNIDASKMIYEGPVAAGGGHTDIYKDDVVYLLWAALHG